MKTLLLTGTILAAGLLSFSAFADDMHGEKGDHFRKKGAYFEKADVNSDKKISLDEFLADKRARFTKMDANNDGFLEQDEMKAAHEKMKEMHEKAYKKRHENHDAE